MPLLPRLKKGLSEVAYRLAAAAGLQRWWQDEAGPSQAIPQAGASWEPTGRPARQRHASIRGGTATRLTLFRPATGAVQATGVTPTPNTVLPRWLDVERTQALAGLPAAPTPAAERPALAHWATWVGHDPQTPLPPLRLIVVWDNLAGHLSGTIVAWRFQQGILPLDTPSSGAW